MEVEQSKTKYVKAIQLRADGRCADDFRPIKFKWHVMKQADGSCYYEQGNAKVICSVFGPLQRYRMRKLDDAAVLRCHLYTSKLCGHDRKKLKVRADKETHAVLEQALTSVIQLENYPRCRIDIVFRILQQDGYNIAVCLNAANFALMDAGICMHGLLTVAACSYANDIVLVDVSDLDKQESEGVVLVGSINGKASASFLDVRGCFPRLIFKQVMESALQANARLDDFFARQTVGRLTSMFTDRPPSSNAPDLSRLAIHDATEVTEVTPITFADYDEAFSQLQIESDDESEA